MRDLVSRFRGGMVAVALVAALAGCGGSDDEPASSAATSPASDGALVSVSAVEYAYTVDPTEVPAGAVTFELTNEGTMGHDLVLDGDPGGNTDIIDPGETDSFTVTLEPGTYTLYCSVGNHRAQGMEMTVTVS